MVLLLDTAYECMQNEKKYFFSLNIIKVLCLIYIKIYWYVIMSFFLSTSTSLWQPILIYYCLLGKKMEVKKEKPHPWLIDMSYIATSSKISFFFPNKLGGICHEQTKCNLCNNVCTPLFSGYVYHSYDITNSYNQLFYSYVFKANRFTVIIL